MSLRTSPCAYTRTSRDRVFIKCNSSQKVGGRLELLPSNVYANKTKAVQKEQDGPFSLGVSGKEG